MDLNGIEYYYIRNNQGDIVGLFDKSGTQIVSYIYDSWGKLVSIDGTMKDTVGVKNPYRYRGYRYDTETGLYYLNSRYYNPEWGRFINADVIAGVKGQLLSHNMFAYCNNSPITSYDPSGFLPRDMSPEGASAAGGGGAEVWGALKLLNAAKDRILETYVKVQVNVNNLISKVTSSAVKPGPVIVGETMKRVELEASKHIDSKILNDMPEYWNMGLKDYEATSMMMEYNRKWILEQFRSGRQIIDIGMDTIRKIPSIFYQMEQNMIKNYQKLHPEWNDYIKLGR